MDSTGLIRQSRVVAAGERLRERDRDAAGARFRGVLDALPDALFVIDETGRIALANRTAQNLFGQDSNDLVGLRLEEVLPSGVRDDPSPAEVDTWGRRSDGSEFPADVALGVLHTHSGPLQVARVRDLTEGRQAEDRFRLLSEVTSDVAFIYRFHGDRPVVDWVTEEAFRRLTGYTLAEWHDAGGWKALAHPDDYQRIRERFQQLRHAHEPVTTEYRIVTKNGEVRWVRATGRAVPTRSGDVVVYGGATDITGIKRAEIALAESEGHLREAQTVAHLGSWQWDVASGAVTWSDELYRIYGRDPVTFIPTFEAYVAHVHPDDRETNLGHLQATLEEDAPYDHEYRIVRADGVVRWLFTQGAVLRDEAGRPVSMHGTCWDVTERHEIEERYRAVSELTSDVAVAFHIEPDGRTVVDWVTGGHERLTGYTVEETEDLGWRNLVHPLDRPAYENRVAALAEGEADGSEVRIVRRDGDIRYARIQMRRVPSEPGTLRFLGAVQDLTEQKRVERLVQDSEERYRAVSELTSDVAYAYHLDEEGRLVVDWVTDGMERLTGYTVDEAVAMSGWRGMIVAEDRDAYERRLERLVAGEAVTSEFRIRTKSRDVRWLEISARSEASHDDVRVFGAARDVTDHKRAELALAVSEANLREAQQVAGLGSWNYDQRAESLVWSDEMFRIHGFDPTATPLTFEQYLELVHPDDREFLLDASARVINGSEAYDFEYRILRGDGEVRWLHARGRPLADDGGSVGMRGTVLDITDRKGVELALAESERRLREAQAVAHVGHFRRDLTTDIIEWSDEIFRIFGMEPGSFEPTFEWLLARVHDDDRLNFQRSVAEAVRNEEPSEYEYRIVRSDGDVRWLHTRSQPEWDAEGHQIALVGVTQDVTSRHEAEEALRRAYERERDAAAGLREADRIKDEFLSTASHELRTPLTAIVGFASALSRGHNLDEATRRHITEKLERNALAIGAMVERLLDFSRLEAGAVPVEPRPIDPVEIVNRTIEMLASDLDRHEVEVTFPPDLAVNADPSALSHVLSNLLANAAKYTPAGSKIRVRAEREGGDAVTLMVEDDGPGIPVELGQRVFDRFMRGPDQPAGQRGTGIGLAIARSYVELMGGRIWVESSPGEGSTFCFTLPLVTRTTV